MLLALWNSDQRGLTLLELAVIHAFCQYCLYSAAIVLVMLILAISLIVSRNRE